MTKPPETPIELLARRSLSDEIVDRLREAILSRSFSPGEHLSEVALAHLLGVSRGPIREALVLLEREGLIVHTRNKGAVVARLSRTDLDEVCSLRLALERLAIERAVRFATPEQMQALQALVDRMRERSQGIMEREAADLDLRFHKILFEASRHQRLLASWLQLQPQILILLLGRQIKQLDFNAVVATGHQQLLDAIRAGDVSHAQTLMDAHLQVSYERVVAGYEGSPE
jgi:DNA-binding GntR family transcriptional regulator